MDIKTIKEQIKAAYLGFAIGDALGATTEFMRPQEIKAKYGIHRNIVGGGWLSLKPGSVTDDTEMSLALGDALLEAKGMDVHIVAKHFIAWMHSKPVDLGHTVRQGLSHYRLTGTPKAEYHKYAAGNGAAMRNLPVIIATLKNPSLLKDWSCLQGQLTHNNLESDIGTAILSQMTRKAILMAQSAQLKEIASQWIQKYPQFNYAKFHNSWDGYIVNTIKTVLYFFFNTYDFESCLIAVVNSGGDADTNAALAGMLAGPFYGLNTIPPRWLKQLNKEARKRIETQVDDLIDQFLLHSNKT